MVVAAKAAGAEARVATEISLAENLQKLQGVTKGLTQCTVLQQLDYWTNPK